MGVSLIGLAIVVDFLIIMGGFAAAKIKHFFEKCKFWIKKEEFFALFVNFLLISVLFQRPFAMLNTVFLCSFDYCGGVTPTITTLALLPCVE